MHVLLSVFYGCGVGYHIKLVGSYHFQELIPGRAADVFHLQPGFTGYKVHEIDGKAAGVPIVVKVEWRPIHFVVNPDDGVFFDPGSFCSRQR